MILNNSKEQLEIVRDIMKKNNISITELAQKLNKSQPATSKVFKQDNISIKLLKEICDAIGYDINIEYTKKEEERRDERPEQK